MFLCSLMTFAQFSGSGSGTENDPYRILNPNQLNQLRYFLNKSGVYFKLMADIDLTEFLEDENPEEGWQPIGTSSAPFKGILDGNGKKVTGFWINRTNSDYVGFFGETNKATIKNFTLKGTNVKGKAYTGFLIGVGRETSILDCTFEGHIYGTSWVGGCIGSMEQSTLSNISQKISVKGSGDYIGGLVGRANGTGLITECNITCKSIEGVNYVGGICGENAGSDNHIEHSVVYSSINGDDYVGGISGHYYSGNVDNCGFVGSINANSNVGGIVGCYSFIASLTNSCAVCNIFASGDNIGGLVGYSKSTKYEVTHSYPNPHSTIPYWTSTEYSKVSLSQDYYCGKIMGNSNVGGIIGNLVGSDILSCYANTVLKGYSNVGGICGRAEGIRNNSIKSNFAIVTSLSSIEGNIGRVFGFKTGNIVIGAMGTAEENKALNRAIVINAGVSQEVHDDEQNGTGVSPTTLKLKATYVAMGWDFTNTWDIQETECYPYMKSQTAPPVIQSQVVSGATTVSGKCVDGGTITLEIDGVKQQLVSTGHEFSFTVNPLQAGHEVRVSAKANGKEQSYFTTEVVSFLGKGTQSDPYQISTAADLTQVYRKGYYKLMNDIDLTSYINQYYSSEGWESIGRDGSETVYFDGNNHKVTGLWCNSTRDNTGLFSCFANGYIKNLTVETAKNKQVKGGANTGILIGKLINGTIENCKVSGSVADGTPVGGMIGKLDGGTLLKCQANVTINVTGGNSYVGGLAGEVNGDVDQCLSSGTLTASGENSYVGGLVGLNNQSSSIINSYSNAITHSSYNASGLVAYNYGKVEKCYALGDIFTMNYGAGIIGYNDGASAIVSHCVAMSNMIYITWESQQQSQGGGYGQRIIGGFKNGAPEPEMSNYALKTMQVSLNNEIPKKASDDIMNGTGKTKTELMNTATYQELDWDMETDWNLKAGKSYPWLRENMAVVGFALPTSFSIGIGMTEALTLTLYPSTLEDNSLTWKSSNTKVATVTADGKVTGIKEGTATITCTSVATGLSTTCKVTVIDGSVTLNKTAAVVEKGKTLTLKETVYPETLEDKTVTWKSSNTKVATVSSAGKVTGVKTGIVTITCTSKATGLSATCKVIIGKVNLDKSEAAVLKGTSLTLTPTVYPTTLENKEVTWKSSNTKVATVSSAGEVKGVKTGVVTITCTSKATGLSTTCKVTVGKVNLDKSEAIVLKGTTLTLKPTVYPTTLENKEVTWKSSNTKVATVSSSGKVTGVKTGVVTITCTSKTTGLSATCKVTVGKVNLDKTEVSIVKGKTVTLTPTVYPTTLSDKSVTWESSDEAVATVTGGKVKGIGAGTATITCTSVATGLSATCQVTVTASSGTRSLDGDDETTDIEAVGEGEIKPYDVYDLSGRMVLHQVTSLDGLSNGVYIVNGKKVLKK